MLIRKALRSQVERDAISNLNNTLDKFLPSFMKALQTELLDQRDRVSKQKNLRDALGAILEGRALPNALSKWLEPTYSTFYDTKVGDYLLDAARAGEDFTELGMADSGVPVEYVEERKLEWIQLMVSAQLKAYAEVRDVWKESRASKEDGIDLMVLATGLAPLNAVYLARQHAATIEKIRKQLAPRYLKRANELLRLRAFRTAEYELAKSYNDAKRLAHIKALRSGLAKQVIKRWVTAKDDDVCKVCAPLHGREVKAKSAATMYNAFDRVLKIVNPPAHIKCRCTVIYIVE